MPWRIRAAQAKNKSLDGRLAQVLNTLGEPMGLRQAHPRLGRVSARPGSGASRDAGIEHVMRAMRAPPVVWRIGPRLVTAQAISDAEARALPPIGRQARVPTRLPVIAPLTVHRGRGIRITGRCRKHRFVCAGGAL